MQLGVANRTASAVVWVCLINLVIPCRAVGQAGLVRVAAKRVGHLCTLLGHELCQLTDDGGVGDRLPIIALVQKLKGGEAGRRLAALLLRALSLYLVDFRIVAIVHMVDQLLHADGGIGLGSLARISVLVIDDRLRLEQFLPSYDDLNSFGNGTFRTAAKTGGSFEFESNNTQPLSFWLAAGYMQEDLGGDAYNIGAGVDWRPMDGLNLSSGVDNYDYD